MSKTWFISDTHFGHKNIIKFKNKDGGKLRQFETIDDHDEALVKNWNDVISPQDRVYHMGDVAINRSALKILGRLNGRKKLIKGNHDIFKLKDYVEYFEDIISYRVYPEHNFIFSHIPVHTDNLYRFKYNFHGHLHANKIDDARYINLCLEHTDMKPVNLQTLIDVYGEKNNLWTPEN